MPGEGVEQVNTPDTLQSVIDSMRRQSPLAELEMKVAKEKAALESATEAVSKILGGTVTNHIELDENAGAKVVKALDPKNTPGLVVETYWNNKRQVQVHYSDYGMYGSYALKVSSQGPESYMVVTLEDDKVTTVTISSEAPPKPEQPVPQTPAVPQPQEKPGGNLLDRFRGK